jgi:hypothetical protein
MVSKTKTVVSEGRQTQKRKKKGKLAEETTKELDSLALS